MIGNGNMETSEAKGRTRRVSSGVWMEGKGNGREEEARRDRVGRVEVGRERERELEFF